MSTNYDAIIIGAGIGGLATAALLSKQHKRILVIEKNPMPGGYAINFRRKNFNFDAGLHLMYGCYKNGSTYTILDKCGVINNIRFLKPKHLYRIIYPNIDIHVKQNNLDSFINDLISLYPKESKKIKAFFQEIVQTYNDISAYDRTKVISRRFINSFNSTCGTLFDKYSANKELKALVFQQWPFFGLPADKLPLFYFAYPWLDYFMNGAFYPKGGAQTISSALSSAITKNGSTVLLNTTVKKILIQNKTVTGVITTDNLEFNSSIVISNTDVHNTYLKYIGKQHLSNDILSDLKNGVPSISAFQVYLGLNFDLKTRGYKDYETWINSTFDLNTQYSDALKNKFNKVSIALTTYSNVDPTSCTPGLSNLVITSFTGYDYWKSLRSKRAYIAKKNQLADILIKRIETLIPGIRKSIIHKEIATPLTMERYTGNYKGSIYGWEPSILQSGFRRMGFKTKFHGLYFVGAWTRPGGGITGTLYSADSLSKLLLKQWEY